MLRALTILAALMTVAAPARATTAMEVVFGCTSTKECVITMNEGGVLLLFHDAADEVRKYGTRVIVDGPCISACVLFASIARENVCVTRNAKMLIHLVAVKHVFDQSGKEITPLDDIRAFFLPPPEYRVEYEYETPDYGRDINEWAARENKIPLNPKKLYTLTQQEMLMFWHPCSQ